MIQTNSSIAIVGIGTAVPPHKLDQADTARRLVQALSGKPDAARWGRRIFKQCGVESRYTCEPNLLMEADECRYLPSDSAETAPTTAERMAIYKRESIPLALQAARLALTDGDVEPAAVTHLITVSCTGQFLPGMDAALIQQLGLAPTVTRIPLNFLGCAAGLKAIGLGRQIVAVNKEAHVLVVCVELCTLHIQPSGDKESLFAASFFGDGASACVIGASKPHHKPIFQLGQEHSVLLPDCAEEMVWEVGNHGFDLYLSPHIPKLIGEFIPAEVERLCGDERLDLWAIHPGGKGIIDILQSKFKLSDEQAAHSLGVLRDYGNVSSATILFVLSAMRSHLQETKSDTVSGIALAFGPGLTAEMIKIAYVPALIAEEQLVDETYA
ncbi:type III polyketide synthase [Paenibacillus sp. FSL H8-0548]|uniref:type III polyketide synthase n=1 Tax=Paenibacillus sp. FSL H8-0548 TaxID=1920422 RepID=UPI00096C4D96|nr:type III polyketide synthase [Paenibacillus sp. FSL H8-0548]OMF22526.1 type III polyketide synthase [Paenibacillus sp. FSL H8-0548]